MDYLKKAINRLAGWDYDEKGYAWDHLPNWTMELGPNDAQKLIDTMGLMSLNHDFRSAQEVEDNAEEYEVFIFGNPDYDDPEGNWVNLVGQEADGQVFWTVTVGDDKDSLKFKDKIDQIL